jgi:hypothetical protein
MVYVWALGLDSDLQSSRSSRAKSMCRRRVRSRLNALSLLTGIVCYMFDAPNRQDTRLVLS